MIEKLYGKNINFLIGSGASFGVIPTLSSNYINDKNEKLSIEEILVEKGNDDDLQNIIYLWYYHEILKVGYLKELKEDNLVFKNYQKLLENLIKLLQRENYQKEKRINIFTTNYDLFFEKAADSLVGKYEFYFNDGSSGNITKKLSMKNYHKKIYHTGIFDNFDREIPIINLFKLHGSVSWKYIKDKNDKPHEIKIEYFENKNEKYLQNLIEEVSNEEIEKIKKEIESNENLKKDIKDTKNELLKNFALIFPEKNKFEYTLYQEFYYQNLRQLSYELEKQNSILIVFGFSFADEHIAEIIKRACNNPTLNIYIFCYKKNTREEILAKLNLEKFPSNIKIILPEDNGNIDFNVFLEKLFEVNSKIESDNNEQ
ncbi:SIR2 family protein [Fusobacterium animalis]|uniref:SIR2 family protein n=1 Tax=Fusobacterium animalis TaxID=76859 RepID=UPI003555E1B8